MHFVQFVLHYAAGLRISRLRDRRGKNNKKETGNPVNEPEQAVCVRAASSKPWALFSPVLISDY